MSAHVAANRAELAAVALRRLARSLRAYSVGFDSHIGTYAAILAADRGEAASALFRLGEACNTAGFQSQEVAASRERFAAIAANGTPAATWEAWADAWDAWALEVSP